MTGALPGWLRARWHWAIPAVVIVGLAYPLLGERTFASDWGNHLWLVHAQAENISQLGLPSFYLQSDLGAFYPYYAFYGGTLYSVLGYGAWLLGANASVVIGSFLALCVAYLAWTWLAVQAGIRGWLMQIPGLLVVTAPYAVTNNFGRGGIPEMIGCSVIALVAAAGISIFRAERLKPAPAVAFVVSIVFLSGSHVLTTAWGVTFLALVGAVMVAADRRGARRHAKRGLRLVWLAALGFGINAWILLPELLLHGKLAENEPDALSGFEWTTSHQLFSLFRDGAHLNPNVTGDVNAQLPLLMAFWTIAFGLFFWRDLGPVRRRIAVGMVALTAFLLFLIMHPSSITSLPSFLTYIQFPYRLMTYVDLAMVGLATLAIAAMQRSGTRSRVPVALLVLVAAVSFFAAVKQNHEVRSWLPGGRDAAVASAFAPPSSWYAFVQFGDATEPLGEPTLPGEIHVPVEEGIKDSYTVTVPPGPEGTILTNVVTGPYFVKITGAEAVARNGNSDQIVRLPASDKPREVTFAGHWDTGVTVGIWITVISLAIAAIALIWGLARLDWSRLRR
ncbi:MAG: hypothetical protein JST08_00155 [Actinobacteria bacterium]|nr:hypothetical protein [Actinomycetota bacterium]